MIKKILGKVILGLLCWCGIGAAQEAKSNMLYFDSVENNDEAASSLVKAKDCATRQDWARAIKFYQYLGKEYPRLRAPIYPNVYVSMNEHCLREMAKLPREAIKVYREGLGNDAIAGVMFDRAMKNRDFNLLQQVADEYFLTVWGDESAKLLADYYLEQGRFGDALGYYNKILDIYPDTNLDKSALLAITAVIRSQLGQADRAKDILDKLSENAVKPVINFAGQQLSVEDIQQQLVKLVADKPASKSNFAEGELSGAAVRWSRFFFRDFKEADIELIKREYDRINSRNTQVGPRYLYAENYFAVWRDGKAILPRNGELLIFDGVSGEVLAGLRADLARVGAFVSAPESVDWRDGVVFFNGRAALTNLWFQQFATRRFYASEAIVGYDLNKKAPLLLTDTPQADAVKEQLSRMARASTPLLRGDSLFSAFAIPYERGQEIYACGFSSVTGKSLWRPQFVLQYNTEGYADSLNIVSKVELQEREGKLYLLTNAGVAACFNTSDGQLNWLTVYPAKQAGGKQGRGGMMDRMNNPSAPESPTKNIFLTERVLVLAPNDSDQIIALDRISGRMYNSFFHEGRKLIGVDDVRAFLIDSPSPKDDAGNVTVVARQLVDGKENWKTMLASGKDAFRAVRDGNLLLVPTTKALYGLDAVTGKVNEEFSWRDREQAGNIELGDNCLIVTAPYRITAICPKGVIDRLEQLAATQKDNLSGRMEITKIRSFNQPAEKAIEGLKNIVDNIGREELKDKTLSLKYDDLRKRLVFLQVQLAKDAASELRESLLRDAIKYSVDDNSRAANLLRLAEFYESVGRWTEAVDNYQETILKTPKAVFVAGGIEFFGAELARQAIERLITKEGRPVYDKYERLAENALTGATAAKSLEQLRAVINCYPNSLALHSALVEMSRLYDETGEHRPAIRDLQAAMQMFPNGPRDQDLIYCMTQHLLAEGAQGLALAGANTLQRDHANKIIAVGDKKIAVADYVKSILPRLEQPRVPDVKFDPAQQPLYQIETKSKSFLLAQQGVIQEKDRDKLFVYDDHLNLTAYNTTTGEMLWSKNTSMHPWMGVLIANADEPGVQVTKVLAGTPADKVGVKDGDVIVKFNNVPVENTEKLIQTCIKSRVGDTVRVEILRAGKTLPFDVTLAHRRDVLISYQFLNDRIILMRQLDSVAMSLSDGEILWKKTIEENEGQLLEAVAKDGLALCHHSRVDEYGNLQNALMQLVDLNSGIVAWRRNFSNNEAYMPYNLQGETVTAHLSPGNPTRLFLFDHLTGRISAGADVNRYSNSMLELSPNRLGIYAQNTNLMNIYNMSTGKLIKEASLPDTPVYRGMWSTANKILLFSNRNICALQPDTLQVLYKEEDKQSRSQIVSDIVSDDRGVLVQRHNYDTNPPKLMVDMIDTNTGKKLWQKEFDLDQPIIKMKLTGGSALLVLRILEEAKAEAGAKPQGGMGGMGGMGGVRRVGGRLPGVAKVELPAEPEKIMVKMLILDRQTGKEVKSLQNAPQDPYRDFVLVNGKICAVTDKGDIIIFGNK